MKFGPQVIEEIVGQNSYNYRFDFSHADLTETTVTTAQSLKIFLPTRAGDKIESVALFLDEEFQDASDTAYNDTQLEVGDSGDLDNFIVPIQANANGSVGVFPAENTGDALPYAIPATPLIIYLTVLAQSGKALANLDKGRGHVLIKFFRVTAAAALPATGGENG